MLDATNRREFLRLGLVRYADARETVDYFETAVQDAVLAVFRAKTNWKNFKPAHMPEGGLVSGQSTGPGERFIQGWVEGTLPNWTEQNKRVWIYLGLYWKPRSVPVPVVASSSAWFEKGRPVPLVDLSGRDPLVSLGPLNKKSERRLIIEPREDFDPAETFALLLDSIDEAIAGTNS